MPALSPHQLEALKTLAAYHGWQLLVLFGSVAREGQGRDIDLAVVPGEVPGLMTQGRWLRELEDILKPQPVDLLVLQDGTSPLTRFQVFRDGVCLYESLPGKFAREQDRAFFLHADAAFLNAKARA
ncbi:nucleotidyltransferase family protein [Thioalkalivibrio sulfidiphilus]|uniref:nucleotidyltransferase family protein n=1 Tax=Thioalkalivibrio sulfidiphilus TaxID=1033854 RepID=UPI003BB0DE86